MISEKEEEEPRLDEPFGVHLQPQQFWKSLWEVPAGFSGHGPGVSLANLEFQSSCLKVQRHLAQVQGSFFPAG